MAKKSVKHDEEYTTYLEYLKACYPNTDYSLTELNEAKDIGTHIAKEAIKKAKKSMAEKQKPEKK